MGLQITSGTMWFKIHMSGRNIWIYFQAPRQDIHCINPWKKSLFCLPVTRAYIMRHSFHPLHWLLLHAHAHSKYDLLVLVLCEVAAAGCGMCVCVKRESVEWAGGNASRSMPWQQADRREMESLHARALRSNYAKYADLAELWRKLGPARSQKNARYATNRGCAACGKQPWCGVWCGVHWHLRPWCGILPSSKCGIARTTLLLSLKLWGAKYLKSILSKIVFELLNKDDQYQGGSISDFCSTDWQKKGQCIFEQHCIFIVQLILSPHDLNDSKWLHFTY